jgi:hypothetical protein
VTLSADPSYRKFTVGQEGGDLVFRLRTPLTGRNGSNPPLPLRIPGVFSTLEARHVTFTYDGLTLRAYVDGVPEGSDVRLGLGASAFGPLIGQRSWAVLGANLAYYAGAFAPAGGLAAIAFRQAPWWRSMTKSASVTAAAAVLFEAALMAATGRAYSPANAWWAFLFAMFGWVAATMVRRRIRWLRQLHATRLADAKGYGTS